MRLAVHATGSPAARLLPCEVRVGNLPEEVDIAVEVGSTLRQGSSQQSRRARDGLCQLREEIDDEPRPFIDLEHDTVLRWRAAHRNADSSLRSRRRFVLKPLWLPADKSVGSR